MKMAGRKWFDGEKDGLFLLVVFAAGLRLFFLLNYENMPGNATDSIVRAFDMIANPSLALNFDGNRSTLFNYALAVFLYFWRDPMLAPRVFTMIFGVLLVFPYYGTLKTLFDARIAFLSSLVLVFCPLHIVQSGTATVDSVYYFFLFASFYYFFKYKNDGEQKPALWASIFLFNMGSLLRFESWLFPPLFFFLLWPKSKGVAFRFLIFSMVFPCAWLLLNQIVYQDCLLTFRKAAMTAHTEILAGTVPYDPRIFSWLLVLWRSSGASLVIGGILGVLYAILTRKRFELALFFLVLLSAFTINSCSARMWHTERYSIILTLLLIPYAWFFADRLLAFLKIRRTVFFIGLLIFPAAETWAIVRKPIVSIPHMFSLMTEDVYNLGLWLKKNVRQDETIIIGADRFDVYPSYFMLRGGILPSSRCLIVWNTTPSFEDRGGFERYLWTHRTKYLVLNSEGCLQKTLGLDLNLKEQSGGGIVFEAVFEQEVPTFGKYIIYRISYQEPAGSKGNDQAIVVQ